jgi:hypothetical protein
MTKLIVTFGSFAKSPNNVGNSFVSILTAYRQVLLLYISLAFTLKNLVISHTMCSCDLCISNSKQPLQSCTVLMNCSLYPRLKFYVSFIKIPATKTVTKQVILSARYTYTWTDKLMEDRTTVLRIQYTCIGTATGFREF